MENNIWTMWWQGKKQAPPIVKACIRSMYQYANYAKVVVLDQYNYQEYVDIPEYIIKKLNAGQISLTHFSDIIRVRLLVLHGGLWLDSTILVTNPIPKELFNKEFYTISSGKGISKDIASNRWTGFLIGCTSNSEFMKKCWDLLQFYWLKEQELVTYLLIDYLIDLVYHSDEKCKILVDNNSENMDVFLLVGNMNKEYRGDLEEHLFNKLNWKKQYSKYTKDGLVTYYYEILKQYHIAGNKVDLQPISSWEILLGKFQSFIKHIYTCFSFHNQKRYGMRYCVFSFLCACMRTSEGRFAYWVYNKYHRWIKVYLSELYDTEDYSEK